MSTYGIVDNVNNKWIPLLIEAGVSPKDIYLVNNLGALINNLKMNDKVFVPSIEVFVNIRFLYKIIKVLEEKHVNFSSINDKIKFSGNTPFKQQYSEFLALTISDERKTLLELEAYYSKYVNTQVLCREISSLNLRTMKRVFDNNGLLKR